MLGEKTRQVLMGGSLAGKSTLLLKRSPPASAPAYDRRSCQSQSALTTGTVLWARYLNLPWYMCVCFPKRWISMYMLCFFKLSHTHSCARAYRVMETILRLSLMSSSRHVRSWSRDRRRTIKHVMSDLDSKSGTSTFYTRSALLEHHNGPCVQL